MLNLLETRDVPSVVYENGFQGATSAGSEWSARAANGASVTPAISPPPVGNRQFLGQFGNSTATLTLDNLPTHNAMTISFDLYVINSWDGSDVLRKWGPDGWSFAIDGQSQLSTTFSNQPLASPGAVNNVQSFGGQNAPAGTYAAFTGASEVNTLGYKFYRSSYQRLEAMDSVYRFEFTVPHSADAAKFDFRGFGLQGLVDESWGLDNVRVVAETLPVVSIEAVQDATETGSQPGMFRLTRTSENFLEPLTISIRTEAGSTTTAGEDYVPLPTEVTFEAGSNVAELFVFPLADANLETLENVIVEVRPGEGYIPEPWAIASVGIRDDELGVARGEIWLDGNGDGERGEFPVTIAGVRVVLRRATGEYVAEGVTNSEGIFEITDVPGGIYYPELVRDGNEDASRCGLLSMSSVGINLVLDLLPLTLGANADPYIKHWHHLIPQEFFKEGSKYAEHLNSIFPADYVHDPKNGWFLQGAHHRSLHRDELRIAATGFDNSKPTNWNKDWADFFMAKPTATKNEILSRMRQMQHRYGLLDAKNVAKIGASVELTDRLTYTEWSTNDDAGRARLRRQYGTVAWNASAAEKTAAGVMEDKYKKARQTVGAVVGGTSPRATDAEETATKKKKLVGVMLTIGAALQVAQPVSAAVAVDAAKLEDDIIEARKHLETAMASRSNPDQLKAAHIDFVTSVSNILKNHFGMDVTTVNILSRLLHDAVIGEQITLPGGN